MADGDRQQFESKDEARNFGRALRVAWDVHTLNKISARIIAHLIESPLFRDANRLLTYVGSRPGELDTRPLITSALTQGLEVLVPITRPAGVMDWARLESLDALRKTSLGLLEPQQGTRRTVTNTDGLCIVPGLLFRCDGHRLGFGGGYYDRFLSAHMGPTVGLCPARCLGHLFPVERHDIPVAWLGTEEGVIAASDLDA